MSHTDNEVSQILSKLDEDELLNNTIIFLFNRPRNATTQTQTVYLQIGHKLPLIVADMKSSDSNRIKPNIRTDLVASISVRHH